MEYQPDPVTIGSRKVLFLNRKTPFLPVIITLVCLLLPISSQAIETAPESVLRFQQKMADKGHAEYQYKLARMYESGNMIEHSLTQARHWYNLAAEQQYKPAQNRLIYLDIKQQGFTARHQDWLEILQREARYNDPEALLLLGQMYKEGTGVEKNLNKALILLRKAAAGNIAEAELEIRQVEKTLAEEEARQLAAQQREQQEREKAAQIARQKQQALIAQQKQQALIAQQKRQALAEQERLNAEKKQAAKIAAAKSAPPPPQQAEPQAQEMAEETRRIDICSGHNRFQATCR